MVRNYKTIQKVSFSWLWLFLLAFQFYHKHHTCSGFPFNNTLIGTTSENDSMIRNNYSQNTNINDEDYFALDLNSLRNSSSCHYFTSTRGLICNGFIDYTYLKAIKNEQITEFIVENYEAQSLYRRKYWSRRNLETGEWYMKLPKLYQKLTGEVTLKDAGLQIDVNIRMIPSKDLKGFRVEGEAFSNKVIKISCRLKGDLYLDFVRNRTVITLDVGAVGKSDWKLQSNMTFSQRNLEDETDSWKTIGIIKSDYASENQFVVYKGTIQTKMLKEECKFLGEVKILDVNLEGFLSGVLSPPQKRQITIPKSAFSSMTIKNIVFKKSNFYNDFDRDSFEGIRKLKRIAFHESKLENMPRLDELFHSSLDLEEIYMEDCVTPGLKFGSLANLRNVKRLSFRGSGPLTFDDTSFIWLRNSNLTSLSLRNSHVKISAKASSVLWSVNNTLKHLDVSHSTLNEEKDLLLILKNLQVTSLVAEGLKLNKIPINALANIRETVTFLSLKENDFRKNFEKNIFNNIFTFPLMVNLRTLNLEECHINYIERGAFDNLPNLKILYLSYNNLENLQDGWTYITPQVTFLSLSHNGFTLRPSPIGYYDLGSSMSLSKFKNLKILDLSNGIFASVNQLLSGLGDSLQNLSLQNTRLEDIPENFFENLTGLRVLDLSHNRDLQTMQPFSFSLFKNLEKLKSLNLNNCKISGTLVPQNNSLEFQYFPGFKLENLQSLDLSVNNLKVLDNRMLRIFPNLKILNLSGNSITHWNKMTSFNNHLHTLYLDENKIETISNEMFFDIKNLKHVKLGNNPFVCESYVYEFLKIINSFSKYKIQNVTHSKNILHKSENSDLQELEFIEKMFLNTKKTQEITQDENMKVLDWSEKNYVCFSWSQARFIPFEAVNENFQDASEKKDAKTETTLLWLTIVIVIGVVISVAIICWKFLDTHLVTRAVRSAFALSFVSRNEKEPTNFRYNVFVSYSDKDRPWVVEKLLPRLESKNEVKVCLHERDFQVGLSIIENILNSVENSRNIILVVSQAFLKSQWCQYEMQLAQFRLIEKGRDQLIVIFLENIPVVKRPKTLRYLMMTKTYIKWPLNPKTTKEIDDFWDRLLKAMDQRLL